MKTNNKRLTRISIRVSFIFDAARYKEQEARITVSYFLLARYSMA